MMLRIKETYMIKGKIKKKENSFQIVHSTLHIPFACQKSTGTSKVSRLKERKNKIPHKDFLLSVLPRKNIIMAGRLGHNAGSTQLGFLSLPFNN